MSNKNDKNNDTSIKIDRRKLLVSGATGAVALGLEGCKLNKTSTVKENRGTTQEAKGKRIKEAAKKNYQESCKALIGQEKLSKSRKENKADWKKLLSTVHDIVIIGSGYGASCAAANLSEALKNKGKSIVVLERGKEWIPGDFPDNSTDLLTEANIHDGREITETFVRAGLFNIHRGENINIVTASGLGGTSLINAGIAIEPKKEVFASSEWAGIWGKNPEDRNKYFKRARNALGVNKTPKFLREDNEKNVKYSRKVEAIQNPEGNKLEDKYNMLDITINDGYQAENMALRPNLNTKMAALAAEIALLGAM
ncbi:MAG: GMC family oxidoreductase N-terminal domain-containing protein [Bdellovibrionota bacterium]